MDNLAGRAFFLDLLRIMHIIKSPHIFAGLASLWVRAFLPALLFSVELRQAIGKRARWRSEVSKPSQD